MHTNAPETVVAYQRLLLREIRERYEELDPDLDHYLGVERHVSEEIDTLEVEFGEVRKTLISDVFTSAGIQPPFFTLLQLVKTKSPFVLGPSGEQVTWTNVARYMYSHGYDMRHFATMGIVPASVEMVVRGWWLCRGFESDGQIAPAVAKLTSMLMLAHLIAASGNLLKTGVIFGMNPLALNWAQMLALPPVTLAWISESLKRNRSIRRKLDEEWASTYRSMPRPLA